MTSPLACVPAVRQSTSHQGSLVVTVTPFHISLCCQLSLQKTYGQICDFQSVLDFGTVNREDCGFSQVTASSQRLEKILAGVGGFLEVRFILA